MIIKYIHIVNPISDLALPKYMIFTLKQQYMSVFQSQ